MSCGLLLKGVIFLDCSGCLLFLPQYLLQGVLFGGYLVENFFSPPVSFQLDQLTDLKKSDAAGSLDLT